MSYHKHLPYLHRKTGFSKRTSRIYPPIEGLALGSATLLAIYVTSLFIYKQSVYAVEHEIKAGLQRTCNSAATRIDGDLHKAFDSHAWLTSPQYEQALAPLCDVFEAAGDLRFIYTCVLKGGKVYLVLNPSPQDDVDQDGLPDPTPELMDPYEDPPPDLVRALQQEISICTEPYQDQWGHFVSAYAPFYDSSGDFVGVLGMDLNLTHYEALLWPVKQATWRTAETGAWLAVIGGIVIWFTRRFAKLLEKSRNRVIDYLETVNEFTLNLNDQTHQLLAYLAQDTAQLVRVAHKNGSFSGTDTQPLLQRSKELQTFLAMNQEPADPPINFDLVALLCQIHSQYRNLFPQQIGPLDPGRGLPARFSGFPEQLDLLFRALFDYLSEQTRGPARLGLHIEAEDRYKFRLKLTLSLPGIKPGAQQEELKRIQGLDPEGRIYNATMATAFLLLARLSGTLTGQQDDGLYQIGISFVLNKFVEEDDEG